MLLTILLTFNPDYGRRLTVEQTYECLSRRCETCNLRFACYTGEVLKVNEIDVVSRPSDFLEEYCWTRYGAQLQYVYGSTNVLDASLV